MEIVKGDSLSMVGNDFYLFVTQCLIESMMMRYMGTRTFGLSSE